jgi:hypothetical protein
VGDRTWSGTLDLVRDSPQFPLAAPALALLGEAQNRWEGVVALKASLLDYLIFHRLNEEKRKGG